MTQLENQQNQHSSKIQKLNGKKQEALDQFNDRKEEIRELKRRKYRIESKRKKMTMTGSEEQMQVEIEKLNSDKVKIESQMRTIRQRMKDCKERVGRNQGLELYDEDDDNEDKEATALKAEAAALVSKLDILKEYSSQYAQLMRMLEQQQLKVAEDEANKI